MPRIKPCLLAAVAVGFLAAAEPPKPAAKFKPSKETTYVLGPLVDRGFIDYEAAINERLKGTSTPQTNAVVLLLKCFGPTPEGAELKPEFYKALGVAAPPTDGDYLRPYSKFFADEIKATDATAFYELESRLKTRPWKPADSPKHAEWLALNEKPLAVAVEASRRPHYYHPMIARNKDGSRGMLIGALLPMAQKGREIANLLALRATLKLAEGKPDSAFEDSMTMHRLARLMGQGGSLIELLVGYALDAIAHNTDLAVFEHGKITAKRALAYQAELMKLPPMTSVADKMTKSDRLYFLDAVQATVRDGTDITKEFNLDGGKKPDADEVERSLKALDWERMLRMGNKSYDRIEAALRLPTRAERVTAAEKIDAEWKKAKERSNNLGVAIDLFFMHIGDEATVRTRLSERIGNIYVLLLLPAFQKVSDAADRNEQQTRNGLIAAGLAAYSAEKGVYPGTLDDLVPKYLPKLPSDVFNGKPLVYRRTAPGYLFYSVGVNGTDDGGKLVNDEPRGDDIGVRMPRK